MFKRLCGQKMLQFARPAPGVWEWDWHALATHERWLLGVVSFVTTAIYEALGTSYASLASFITAQRSLCLQQLRLIASDSGAICAVATYTALIRQPDCSRFTLSLAARSCHPGHGSTAPPGRTREGWWVVSSAVCPMPDESDRGPVAFTPEWALEPTSRTPTASQYSAYV